MLPIGDDNSGQRTIPFVTYLLIVANIFVFLVENALGDSFVLANAVVPAHLIANPIAQFFTVFTAMFMHASWLHLLGNMLYLWIFGDNLEDRFGHSKFLVFYLLCGIAATFAQVLANPSSLVPNLGASGAIAGVLGGYLILFPGQRVRVLVVAFIIRLPAVLVIGFWIVLQILNESSAGNAASGVAYMAHIGGFAAGIILTLLLRGGQRRPSVFE